MSPKEKQAVLVYDAFLGFVHCRVRHTVPLQAYEAGRTVPPQRGVAYPTDARLGSCGELRACDEGVTWARGWRSIGARALRAARALLA